MRTICRRGCQITIDQPLNDTCTASIEVYNLNNGDWQQTVNQTQNPLCGFMNEYSAIISDLAQYGNFPTKCPIQPGEVEIRRYYPNKCLLPRAMPDGQLMFQINIKCEYDGEMVTVLEAELEERVVPASSGGTPSRC
ncbi:DUF1091 domain-containing protein [Aspergillus vadensis CBS 113365]|uniref:Phosphatidylglycerol/phosphatidylinositol transfer protein n=1 Tax=Aspergillus vadensis (strain CBS 113365 / IMI 142717 / IBT 24658) TaxID=1448311 RepID=A0A319BY09_ASPVC|nr:hypothetical protein BO88DRAFT_416382 [Aspergillus vadensis CBS 113365]PYH68018.1 hypothetical protein BO88DRAFT_416382 [Aspergillus vadensis CBS 113365]